MSCPYFSPDNHCKKCGHDQVGASYQKYLGGFPGNGELFVIKRSCHRCGHTWDETPIDRDHPITVEELVADGKLAMKRIKDFTA